MKRYIILINLFIIFSGIVYSQTNSPTHFFQMGMNADQMQKATERQIRDNIKNNSFFGKVNLPWLDGSIMRVLQYFDGIHYYFNLQVRIIATICLILSLGIGAIKLIFGMAELNKLLVSTFMAVLTFMIVLQIFPTMMATILKITSDLTYNAMIL